MRKLCNNCNGLQNLKNHHKKRHEPLILDVGYGDKPRGNVNCDLFIKKTVHRTSSINPKKIDNFVLCDSQYLPFKLNCFKEIICSHVIEHIKDPYKLLDELMRTCKHNGTVYLSLPHRFSYGAKNKGHIHFFTRRWFEKNLKYPFDIKITTWTPLKFLLFFPNEIKIKIYKKEAIECFL